MRSLEFLFKSGGFQKSQLTSSPATFRSWLKYVNQLLDGLWLSPLTKINPYQMPKKEFWRTWDENCLHRNRSCIPGLKQDCEDSKIFYEYLDEDGIVKPISKSTHIDTLNAMVLLVLKQWPSLIHTLNQLLIASIDPISLPFLIPECVGTPDTIRSMYFGGINYHNHNSEYIVMMKVQSFQKRGSHQANINEPPETVLQKLRLASQEINAMAVNQDAQPISPTMLRMKFMEIMQDIPQYKHAIGILNLQAKEDVNGNPVPLSLDEYTKKLQIIFLESKESSFRQRVNLVEEEQTNVAYTKGTKSSNPKYPSPFSGSKDFSQPKSSPFPGSKDFSKSKQKPSSSFGISTPSTKKLVCYSFRDRGTCSYGKDCKFLHEKSSGAYSAATQEELDEQCGANAVYQYKMKKFHSKQRNAKRMSNHRDKVKSSNSRKHTAHLTEILEEDTEKENPEEEKEVEELNSAEVDQPSEDPFDFSSSDSESQEDL